MTPSTICAGFHKCGIFLLNLIVALVQLSQDLKLDQIQQMHSTLSNLQVKKMLTNGQMKRFEGRYEEDFA